MSRNIHHTSFCIESLQNKKKRAQEQLRRLLLPSKLNTLFFCCPGRLFVCLILVSFVLDGVVQICLPKKQLGKARRWQKYCSKRAAA